MKKKALVVTNQRYQGYSTFIAECGFEVHETLTPEKVDGYSLVHFIGGGDLAPALYNEAQSRHCSGVNIERDKKEARVFYMAKDAGIPMFGICRGAQFLCAMNGGKLIQDVTGHGMENHGVEIQNGKHFKVTSSHHQMMVPGGEGFKVFAFSSKNRSSRYIGGDEKEMGVSVLPESREVEAVYWKDTKSLGVQWHPEWMKRSDLGWLVVHEWVKKLGDIK